jgi:hypothetical protein
MHDRNMAKSGLRKQARHDRQIDFSMVNIAARQELRAILLRWLPDGQIIGHEFVARNPRRADRNPGSFKVNVRTGRWSDFATGDKGGDPVSLAAYLFGLSQVEAARRLSAMVGCGDYKSSHCTPTGEL